MNLATYLKTENPTRGAVIARSPSGGVAFGPVWEGEAPVEELRPLLDCTMAEYGDGLIFLHVSEDELRRIQSLYK